MRESTAGISVSPSNALRKVTVIRPTRGWVPANLRELWEYRELLYFLAWRNVKVRYKQTLIGIAWVVIQPLAMSLVVALVFSRVIGLSTGNVPYVLFVYVGMLPWNLFARGLTDGSGVLIANQHVFTKVYFPRLVLPASLILGALVDFFTGFIVLVGLMAYYHFVPTAAILLLPFFALMILVVTLGVAFLLSAINARYRDVGATVPFLTTFLLLATPVMYPLAGLSGPWYWIYAMNPLSGVVDGFRSTLLGMPPGLDLAGMSLSMSVGVGLFLIGLYYFRRLERNIADVV